MSKQKKPFDCTQQKRLGTEKIFKAVRSMNLSSELEFWRRRTLQLNEFKQRNFNKKKEEALKMAYNFVYLSEA